VIVKLYVPVCEPLVIDRVELVVCPGDRVTEVGLSDTVESPRRVVESTMFTVPEKPRLFTLVPVVS